MSTEYYIYTEAKINGKWELIDSLCKKLETGEYEVSPTYISGSRSYFSESERKLEELSSGRPKEISNDLRSLVESVFGDNRDLNELPVIAVNFADVKSLASGHDHHGFVLKDDVQAYKSGELDDIIMYSTRDTLREWELPVDAETLPQVTNRPGEFWALTPEERAKVFKYMEWDDPDGWRGAFKEIVKRVEMRIADFRRVNFLTGLDDVRLLLFVY